MLLRQRAFYSAGKFEQYRRGAPYAIVSQAFDGLVQQLLTESETRIRVWRERILAAIGLNGRLVAEVVPHLERLIGPQPPAPSIEASAREARFQYVFRRFVGVFARPEHPVVLLLDDLQWADVASLKLLRHLLTHPDTRDLLVIGAYRDNEVGPDHPLMATLDALRLAGTRLRPLRLGPLPEPELRRLIADMTHREPREVEPLAELVREKTGGNPFFVNQFLTALHQEGLLSFDPQQARWGWDLAGIQAKGYTDNLGDLMVQKLGRLEPPAQKVLQLAAACGHQVDLKTITVISRLPAEEAGALLDQAAREGLVMRSDHLYRFVHDRVQQAAYSSLPEAERTAVHLQIGRMLLAHVAPERLEERVFEIVDQLNQAAPAIAEPADRRRVAELDLLAGQKAKASAAYGAAEAYLRAGLALLPEGWTGQDGLSFALHRHLAESRFLNGDLAAAEADMRDLLARAASRVDAAAATVLLISLYTSQARYAEAIATGAEHLSTAEILLPTQPTTEDLAAAYQALIAALGDRRIEDLGDLPAMVDPDRQAAMDVLAALGPPSHLSNPKLSCAIALRIAALCLEHGNTDGSFFAYAWLGALIGEVLGEYRDGYRFAKMAYDMVEQRNMVSQKARVGLLFAGMVSPWTQPFRASIGPARAAIETALRLGDMLFAGSLMHLVSMLRLAAGDPLEAIAQEIEARKGFVQRAGIVIVTETYATLERLVKNLRGQTRHFSTFDEDGFDQAAFEASMSRWATSLPVIICFYAMRKTFARFMSGDYEEALRSADQAEPLLWSATALTEVATFHQLAALARAARFHEVPPAQQRLELEALRDHQRRLRAWADCGPANFLPRWALVSAEIARLADRPIEAERLYEEAIASSRESGFVHQEGLGYELASRFYRQRGLTVFADVYLRMARACYERWGAAGKVQQLEAAFPQVREQPARGVAVSATYLDLMSVLKASQALSREILLPRLVETLMRIAIENAGAQKGSLVLVRDHALWLYGEASVERDRAPHVPPRPVRAEPLLPEAILTYVRRTHEKVLLDDASRPSLFAADAYIVRNRPLSVLCLPILRQAELVGMLYLENNLMAGAFTPDRIVLLEHLATQAAISLENASLYGQLHETEERLRAILDNATAVIYLKDLEGRFLLVNRAFERLFRVREAEILGKTAQDLFLKDMAAAMAEHDRRALEASGLVTFEETIQQDDGPHSYVTVKFPLFDQSGKPYAVCSLATDITERKKAAEEIARRQAELEQAKELERLRSEFVHTVSHELRTPLTTIKGFLEFLEDEMGGPLTDEQRDFVTQIEKSALRLELLANDLLDFARMEAGTFRLALQEADLAAQMRDVALSFVPQATYRRIELMVDVPAAPVMVRMDAVRIEQVLNNLLSNAIKFATEGGRIEVRLRIEGDAVRCEVSDTGEGIAEEDIPKLFQRFGQLKGGKAKGGTGLGLSISKAIVEAHGGRIGVNSVVGQGSTFWFTLPVAGKSA
jgi:PAS domain S-box-containing protein